MKPIVIYSDKILNALSIFFRLGGISVFPIVILRERYINDSRFYLMNNILVNHETIHFRQQLELMVIPFYVLYFTEYLIRYLICFDSHLAYMNISFEREAYENERDLSYADKRKLFSWVRYIL